MADRTLKQLISLIESKEQIDVRRAAVRVAAALKPSKEHALNQVLLAVLDEDDAALRGLAVEALGSARAEEALPRLVQLVEHGGPEVEVAVDAIGHLGARGTKALGKIMHQATPVLRRRIAAALALVGTDSAVLATAEALLDEDPGVVAASARSLAQEVPQLTPGQKKVLAEHLLMILDPKVKKNKSRNSVGSKHAELEPEAEAAVLRVLAALHVPGGDEVYWPRIDSQRPSALRSAALQALAAMEPPTNETKLQRILACASDSDFQIVAPALMLLKKVSASRKNIKYWLKLLEAPDVAAHMLAVEKLRQIDTDQVAKSLVRQLNHPDKDLRDSALAALRELKSGRGVLFGALLEAESPDEAWSFARALSGSSQRWSSALLAKAFAQASKWQESDDRRADALWFFLRTADGDMLRDQLADRAKSLRKKKEFARSVAYWRLLTRDPAVGAELRFELAATALKLSNHDTSVAAREADPALNQFNRLLQDTAFELAKHVLAAKWLEESDLFYLGFHFSEQQRLAREFGRQVLEAVVERWPRTQLGKNAKQKLKSEGL